MNYKYTREVSRRADLASSEVNLLFVYNIPPSRSLTFDEFINTGSNKQKKMHFCVFLNVTLSAVHDRYEEFDEFLAIFRDLRDSFSEETANW